MPDTQNPYAPLDGTSVADEAYARIVDLILTRNLRPGERTSVNLLAARLGLGKTPIKEAITRLQTEGVLTVVGRSGTTVNGIGPTQACQIFGVRRILEDHAAEAVTRNITKLEISELRRLLGELRVNSFDRTDLIRAAANFVRANVAFHSLIIAAARNPFLDRLYAQVQLQLQIVTYLSHRGYDASAARTRQDEHEGIVKALEKRDPKELKRRLRAHAQSSETLILQSLGETPADAPPLAAPRRAVARLRMSDSSRRAAARRRK